MFLDAGEALAHRGQRGIGHGIAHQVALRLQSRDGGFELLAIVHAKPWELGSRAGLLTPTTFHAKDVGHA